MILDAHTTYSMLASIASVGAAEYDYDTYFQHIEEEPADSTATPFLA